ncbi:hypothetical protein [Nocardioides soli]|uniref:ELWxxDGT repeat protein n=1 Tax=Nocardioides soli TaxID=1036020 RepID=A0A7W4VVQ6_9ACTN|nr:hypothetical protein [Nocardioides soli]MBB3042284.1 ELWxxDGT repeat protein [Nocardioides soli]
MVEFQGYTYFFADDDVHGRELWRSDGTAAGTTLFADLTPGDASSDTTFGAGPTEMVATRNRLYFLTGSIPYTLWYTDGTSPPRAASTSVPYFRSGLVADTDGVFIVNAASLYGMRDTESSLRELGGKSAFYNVGIQGAALDGVVYYANSTGGNDFELWRSDLTAAGTSRLSEIRAGSASSEPLLFMATSTHVYFVADDGYHGRELWVTDGTADGTRRLTDLATGTRDTAFGSFSIAGDRLYFTATRQGAQRTTLWRTTGSTPTAVGDLTNTATGIAQPFADRAVVSQNFELWAARPGDGGGLNLLSSTYNRSPVVTHRGHLYFRGWTDRYAGDRSSIYRSTGTAAGTVAVWTSSSYPQFLSPAGRNLMYFVTESGLGYRLRFYVPRPVTTKLRVRLNRTTYVVGTKPRVQATAVVSGVALGRVTFYDGRKKLRTVAVRDGRASVRLTARPSVGKHRIRGRLAPTSLTTAAQGSAVVTVKKAVRSR